MSTTNLPPEQFSTEFPRAMGRPANAALVTRGVTTLAQVAHCSESELLSLHGVGPKAIRILKEELARIGLAMKK